MAGEALPERGDLDPRQEFPARSSEPDALRKGPSLRLLLRERDLHETSVKWSFRLRPNWPQGPRIGR